MSGQPVLNLDGPAEVLEPLPPHQRHSETSREAAAKLRPLVRGKRLEVLREINRWRIGVTDNDLIRHFCAVGWNVNTPRARRIELCRLGYVRDTGDRHEGSTVWGVTETGRRALEEQKP